MSLGTLIRSSLGIKLGVLQQGKHQYYLNQSLTLDNNAGDIQLPRISIVTPSYNQGEFIGRTIQSVLSQEYPNLEYIVQDNQSNDGTLKVLESVKTENFIYQIEKDTGQADAINKGFAHSTGEIMGYLNSDDVLLPGVLIYIAHIFQKNPQIEVIYGNRVLIDNKDNIVGRWIIPYHDSELLRHIDYIPQETLFWRRSLWDRAGGSINDNLAFALDWDLLLRFVACNAYFLHLPYFLGGFRIHEHQKTGSNYKSVGISEMKLLRSQYAPTALSKIFMPIRHSIFLLKHIYNDKRLSMHLKELIN